MIAGSPIETRCTPGLASREIKTILIVDDSDDDIMLTRLMFRRSRILNPLQGVHSAREAVCYFKGEGAYADRQAYPIPILLFLDLHLRDGSGFDILRFLQARQVQFPLAVVVLSGSDVNGFKMAYDLGAHSFIGKPLKFEDFESLAGQVRGLKLTQTEAGYLLSLA